MRRVNISRSGPDSRSVEDQAMPATITTSVEMAEAIRLALEAMQRRTGKTWEEILADAIALEQRILREQAS